MTRKGTNFMPDLTSEYLALRDQYIEARFTKLNPMQRQAVFTTEGPLLILAGAGSGKTTVLVNRIANIIRFGSAHGSKELARPVTEQDLNALRTAVATGRDLPRETAYLAVRPARPWNVLAITFTNKAAGELKERLRAMLGETLGGDVFASTFHSACVRFLRRDAERIGFPKSFTIYDSDDQQRVIKQIYKDLMIDDKFLPVKSAVSQISSFKDKLLSAEDIASEALFFFNDSVISYIYTTYAARLKKAGAMDFDDLIYHTVKLLQNDEEARRYYQDKFKYVVVDEYQDTSIAQFNLVRLLAGGSNNVCVVGDDDQSIYKFRGATIENILNLSRCSREPRPSAWNRTTVPLPTSSMPPTASSKTTQAARVRLCGPRTATAKRSTTTPPPTSRTKPAIWPTSSASICGRVPTCGTTPCSTA